MTPCDLLLREVLINLVWVGLCAGAKKSKFDSTLNEGQEYCTDYLDPLFHLLFPFLPPVSLPTWKATGEGGELGLGLEGHPTTEAL